MRDIITGEIETSVKETTCNECRKTIPKQRVRIRTIVQSGFRYPYNYFYHLDCFVKSKKSDLIDLREHIKRLEKLITKEYLEERNNDLLLEAI